MRQKACRLLAYFLILLPAPVAAENILQHPMLSAPGGPISIDGTGEHLIYGITNKSIFYLKVKWPTDQDRITRIGVCWESPRSEHEQYRILVKNAVNNTWGLYSSVQFQYWGPCTPKDTHAIHIAVGDYWPQSNLGTELEGVKDGMKLNFDFRGPAEWMNCSATPEACIAKVAVHEFGHALGFMHEQTRKDTPDVCLAKQAGEEKVSGPYYTTSGTPWDPDSVMNYCNPVWNNNGQLSSLDVLALQKVYGAPKPGNY